VAARVVQKNFVRGGIFWKFFFYYFINVSIMTLSLLKAPHDYNKSDLIIEQAIVNVIATVRMLDDTILREKDEGLINEVKGET
jgi:hypothetical protein